MSMNAEGVLELLNEKGPDGEYVAGGVDQFFSPKKGKLSPLCLADDRQPATLLRDISSGVIFFNPPINFGNFSESMLSEEERAEIYKKLDDFMGYDNRVILERGYRQGLRGAVTFFQLQSTQLTEEGIIISADSEKSFTFLEMKSGILHIDSHLSFSVAHMAASPPYNEKVNGKSQESFVLSKDGIVFLKSEISDDLRRNVSEISSRNTIASINYSPEKPSINKATPLDMPKEPSKRNAARSGALLISAGIILAGAAILSGPGMIPLLAAVGVALVIGGLMIVAKWLMPKIKKEVTVFKDISEDKDSSSVESPLVFSS